MSRNGAEQFGHAQAPTLRLTFSSNTLLPRFSVAETVTVALRVMASDQLHIQCKCHRASPHGRWLFTAIQSRKPDKRAHAHDCGLNQEAVGSDSRPRHFRDLRILTRASSNLMYTIRTRAISDMSLPQVLVLHS